MPWWVSGTRPVWKQMKWVESNERYISRRKWSLTTNVLRMLEDAGDGDCLQRDEYNECEELTLVCKIKVHDVVDKRW